MSEAKEKIQNFMKNLTQYVTLHEPQTYKNLTLIPLVLKDEILDFITIKEAEASELGFIQEMESEQVASLQAVNRGTKPILIPYMQVIKGGKQDRAINEPILIAAGTTINIPSNCVERSRWNYRSVPEMSSKRFQTSSQKMTIGLSAVALRAPYRQRSTQSKVWESIESLSGEMNIAAHAAPTRSLIQMQETQIDNLNEYASHFKLINNQAGIIGLVNNQVVGLELYGNPAALKIFWEDLLNSFSMEAILRARYTKDLKLLDTPEIHERALRCFENHIIEFKERNGIGLGIVIEFADQNLIWAGITLVHNNKFAHIYITGQSIFPEENKPIRQLQASQLHRPINRNEPSPII